MVSVEFFFFRLSEHIFIQENNNKRQTTTVRSYPVSWFFPFQVKFIVSKLLYFVRSVCGVFYKPCLHVFDLVREMGSEDDDLFEVRSEAESIDENDLEEENGFDYLLVQ